MVNWPKLGFVLGLFILGLLQGVRLNVLNVDGLDTLAESYRERKRSVLISTVTISSITNKLRLFKIEKITSKLT